MKYLLAVLVAAALAAPAAASADAPPGPVTGLYSEHVYVDPAGNFGERFDWGDAADDTTDPLDMTYRLLPDGSPTPPANPASLFLDPLTMDDLPWEAETESDCGITHYAHVWAVDEAGQYGPASTIAYSEPCAAVDRVLTATEEAYTDSAEANKVHNGSALWLDGDPKRVVWTKFVLPADCANPTNVRLSMTRLVGTSSALNKVHLGANGWSQTTLTAINAPIYGAQIGTWVSGDSTALPLAPVAGGSTLSFAVDRAPDSRIDIALAPKLKVHC